MRILVSVFELRDTATRPAFEAAWGHFSAALSDVSPNTQISPVCARIPDSGYDTDMAPQHNFLTTIAFPDAAEADRVWTIMEDAKSPLNTAHVAMLCLTRDQMFTFWGED